VTDDGSTRASAALPCLALPDHAMGARGEARKSVGELADGPFLAPHIGNKTS
jgi:hypothetical protein